MKQKFKIPFYAIDKFYNNNKNKILAIADTVFSSGQHLKSKEIEDFEKEIAAYCNRKYAISVNSGTDALFFSFKATGLPEKTEILVTPFSFVSSATSIIRAGMIPVFVDIDPDTFQININDAKNKITKKTGAILSVNIFGQTPDYDTLYDFAGNNNLLIIEDAAQSMGSEYKNRKSGSFGEISCISFDPTKIISAFGTGGCILTDNKKVYETINILKNNGKNQNGEYINQGYNSQISSLQARLLSWQLSKLDSFVAKRIKIAGIYYKELQNISQISLPANITYHKNNYHKFVIKAKNRDKLKLFLEKAGIQTLIHYAKAIPHYPVFNKLPHKAGNIDNTLKVAAQVLSLPVYPELQEKEIMYICNKIKIFYKNQ